MSLFYYNAAVDTAWDTEGNWWADAEFTISTGILPQEGSTVYLAAGMSIGPSTAVTLNHIYVVGASTSGETFGVNFAGATGNATFNGFSYNNWGTVSGDATFNDSSYAYYGLIAGDATFNDYSYSDLGTVSGDATFNDSSYNGGNVDIDATFNDSSYNDGIVTGSITYNGLTGWLNNKYYIKGEPTTLPESGTGYNENDGIFYISATATTLDENGTGWNEYDETYYIGGNGTTLNSNGKTPQTISAFSTVGNQVVGSAPFTVTAPTASSGLAVTLSVKSGPATISGNTVTLTGATGTVVLAANQAGNATFDPAAEVTTSFSVTAAVVSVKGPKLLGATSSLILATTSFTEDSTGQCILRRVYSCATSYEATARTTLAIDSAPLDGFLPSGVYSLVLNGLSVERNAGISTFSADYIGLSTKAIRTTFSESTLSYSFVKAGTFTFTGTTPPTQVPVRYVHTGQYSAPVGTTTHVATSAASLPALPSSATQAVRATSSFRAMMGYSGQTATPESFTATYSTAWVLTDSQATPYGNHFLVTATYTRMITGVTN